jgi:hypothetical protein
MFGDVPSSVVVYPNRENCENLEIDWIGGGRPRVWLPGWPIFEAKKGTAECAE